MTTESIARIQIVRGIRSEKEEFRARLSAQAEAIPYDRSAPWPIVHLRRSIMDAIFAEITPYPSKTWRDMIAIATRQAPRKVTNWFALQRMKRAQAGDSQLLEVANVPVEGQKVRVRRCVADEAWTDSKFQKKLDDVVEAKAMEFEEEMAAMEEKLQQAKHLMSMPRHD